MNQQQKDVFGLLAPPDDLLKFIVEVLTRMKARGQPINPVWERWIERLTSVRADYIMGSIYESDLAELEDALVEQALQNADKELEF